MPGPGSGASWWSYQSKGWTGCYLDYSSTQKPHLSGGMVAHAFKPSTWEPKAGRSVSSRLARAIQRETLFQSGRRVRIEKKKYCILTDRH